MMYLIIVKAVIKMNTTKYMIIIKGEIKTRDVKFLEQDDASHKMNVTFNNRKTYSYTLDNVEFLENPKFLDPRKYHLSKDGKNFFSVEAIYEFVGKDATYIHVCFKNNVERDYYKSQLDIQESYLNKKDAANVFDYIKEISKLSNLKNESNGEQLLPKKFKKISFLRSDVALTKYLNPKSLKKSIDGEYMPIFPFGCNNSQYVAVKRAMENQISVIQGPPGTGKTQTILNIIDRIEQYYPGKVKFSVASLLNGMSKEHLAQYEERKINLHYLVKTSHEKYEKLAAEIEENGKYHFYKKDSKYLYNVLNELAETGKESKSNDFNALLNLNIKLYDGLSYQGTFSYHNSSTNQRDWKTEESASVASTRGYDYKQYDENDDEYWKSALPYGGILDQGNTVKTGYTVRNGLSFIKVLGDIHDMNIIVGSELRGTKYEGVRSTGYGWTPTYGERFMPVHTDNFVNNYIDRMLPTNTNTISRVASFFGSATYTYNNRYVMNFNIRSDGANKFGSNPKYRWLPTWSIAGKWLLTNEGFMSRFADNGHYVSVRGSYGIQGNIHDDATPNLILEVGNRNTISNLEQSTIYRLPNPDLRWEKTTSWNVAADFSFWNGRLSGSLDVYKKHTEDLIIEKTVATSNGKSRLYMNAGEMDNQGFEGNLSVEIIQGKKLNWRFNVNFGRNTSEVTLANDDIYSDLEVINKMLDGNLAVKGEKLGSM